MIGVSVLWVVGTFIIVVMVILYSILNCGLYNKGLTSSPPSDADALADIIEGTDNDHTNDNEINIAAAKVLTRHEF
jgi:hypothetical protein